MKKYISISEVAIILGLSVCTLRRWDREGKLLSDFRTIGGHRRYSLDKIINKFRPQEATKRQFICYVRVSSYDQEDK